MRVDRKFVRQSLDFWGATQYQLAKYRVKWFSDKLKAIAAPASSVYGLEKQGHGLIKRCDKSYSELSRIANS